MPSRPGSSMTRPRQHPRQHTSPRTAHFRIAPVRRTSHSHKSRRGAAGQDRPTSCPCGASAEHTPTEDHQASRVPTVRHVMVWAHSRRNRPVRTDLGPMRSRPTRNGPPPGLSSLVETRFIGFSVGSGGPGESRPRAPTERSVTVSRHSALVILVTRRRRLRSPTSTVRIAGDSAWRSLACTRWPSSAPRAVCTSGGSIAPSRR